jgi:hypothetical protein
MGLPCQAKLVVHGCNGAKEQLFWINWAARIKAIELPLNFGAWLVCSTEAALVTHGEHLTHSGKAVCGDSPWLIPP